MFEQHPVPQQISSYQFRLVGDMTLKQFFQLAAGAVIALIIYSLPLPAFLKWPLVVLAVVGGAAFAFLPIQDRPLEKWLVAFFRNIYNPTLFTWTKSAVEPVYFQTTPGAIPAPQVPEEKAITHPNDVAEQKMEQGEATYLNKVEEMIKQAPTNPSVADMQSMQQIQPGNVTVEAKPQGMQTKPEVKKVLTVPQAGAVTVEKKGFETPSVVTPVTQTNVYQTFTAAQPAKQAAQAQFSPDAAPPAVPSQPNIIVGQVVDSKGKIVEGAILEVKDPQGRPVRALKTNKAGHFMIVTPLANGNYNIIAEKADLAFNPVTIEAKGVVINPIVVRSNNAQA